MTNEEKRKVYQQLAAPFPEEAIERTDGRQTGRGYNTTGLKAQFVVDRLNTVLGIGGWRVHREVTVKESSTSSGRRSYEAVCDLILELGSFENGKFEVFAEALSYGGHVAMLDADARKGSASNALKRAAAMLGCGAAAYRGELDDDNLPAEQVEGGFTVSTLPTQRAATQAAPPTSLPVAQSIPRQTPTSPSPSRNRLTSKQLGAIQAIARKLGYDPQGLRAFVKQQFGAQPEFLTRDQASKLIGAMSAQAGNGHVDQIEPGAEG